MVFPNDKVEFIRMCAGIDIDVISGDRGNSSLQDIALPLASLAALAFLALQK